MSANIQELLSKASGWEAALNEDGHLDDRTRVTIKEAFGTPDAPILFPKVISRTLKEAAEPVQLVTPLLSTVRLGKGRSMEFPAVNAIQAAEIPEGQEYPEQQLAFAKQIEGKVSKKGVKIVFTEEVISDSQWDIVGLHVRAAGRAMARLKEQIALGRFKDAATTVLDNDDGAVSDTTGRDINGALNLSLAWDDLVDMAAVLHAEMHAPTDFILHPLMWPLFLKTAPFHVPGAPPLGWNTSLSSKDNAVSASAPLGLNVIMSPFVSFTAKSGQTPAKSDVFLIDRNEIGSILVKDDLSTDEWTDQSRDIRSLKIKERYDIICYGDGEGITVAKNVRLVSNYDVYVTRSLTSPL
jgi:Phage capsid family